MKLNAGAVTEGDVGNFMYPKRSNICMENTPGLSPSSSDEISLSHLPPRASRSKFREKDPQISNTDFPGNLVCSTLVKNPVPLNQTPHIGHKDLQPVISLSDQRVDLVRDQRLSQLGAPGELTLDVEDLDIPWSDLDLKERIGAGTPLSLIWITFQSANAITLCLVFRGKEAFFLPD